MRLATATITYEILKEVISETTNHPVSEINSLLKYTHINNAGELSDLLENHFCGIESISSVVDMLRSEGPGSEDYDYIQHLLDYKEDWLEIERCLFEMYPGRCDELNGPYDILVLNVIDVEDRTLFVLTYNVQTKGFLSRECNF